MAFASSVTLSTELFAVAVNVFGFPPDELTFVVAPFETAMSNDAEAAPGSAMAASATATLAHSDARALIPFPLMYPEASYALLQAGPPTGVTIRA
jgi:hypothetical protein